MKKLNVPLYFACSNLYHVSKVMMGRWNDELGSYWDADGEYDCTKLGHNSCIEDGPCSTFSSTSKKEVQAYVLGQQDLRRVLKSSL